MKRERIIELALATNVEDKKLSFISSFDNPHDAEIVAIITSWLSNGAYNELETAKDIISMMKPTPFEFVASKDIKVDDVFKDIDVSVNATMTSSQLYELILRLRSYITFGNTTFNGIFKPRDAFLGRKRYKYPHERLSALLGGNTGFQTKLGGGTFYRYYLLFYWMTHKTTLWGGLDTSNALLPCNHRVFNNAYKLGIFKKPILFTNVDNAIKLTQIARSWLGNDDFYLMYEFLNSYNGDGK